MINFPGSHCCINGASDSGSAQTPRISKCVNELNKQVPFPKYLSVNFILLDCGMVFLWGSSGSSHEVNPDNPSILCSLLVSLGFRPPRVCWGDLIHSQLWQLLFSSILPTQWQNLERCQTTSRDMQKTIYTKPGELVGNICITKKKERKRNLLLWTFLQNVTSCKIMGEKNKTKQNKS